jgi:hypothetical protein
LAATSEADPPSKLNCQQSSRMNSAKTVSSSAAVTPHDAGQ